MLEVIDDLSNDSFCVLNHLFVNEGMEDAFEKKFLERLNTYKMFQDLKL